MQEASLASSSKHNRELQAGCCPAAVLYMVAFLQPSLSENRETQTAQPHEAYNRLTHLDQAIIGASDDVPPRFVVRQAVHGEPMAPYRQVVRQLAREIRGGSHGDWVLR